MFRLPPSPSHSDVSTLYGFRSPMAPGESVTALASRIHWEQLQLRQNYFQSPTGRRYSPGAVPGIYTLFFIISTQAPISAHPGCFQKTWCFTQFLLRNTVLTALKLKWSNTFKTIGTLSIIIDYFDMFISSPEPSGSQGELIVYPCSVVRPSSVRRPPFSKIFFSETAWPIKAKFYRKHLWEGGTNVYINNPGHMTKMAAMPIYGKNPSKIFFSGTTGPISTKLGMKHR